MDVIAIGAGRGREGICFDGRIQRGNLGGITPVDGFNKLLLKAATQVNSLIAGRGYIGDIARDGGVAKCRDVHHFFHSRVIIAVEE